ncbi:MAG: phage tail sheath family protein, partial [Phycisphaerales bacterium]
MPTYRTPDVYVEEISVFPPSVAEVETAVPAFVGHTQSAKRSVADDLRNVPTKVYSFTEFEQYFGLARDPIEVTVTGTTATAAATPLVANEAVPPFRLAHAVKMYFDNGGGKCYIVSIGALDTPLDAGLFEAGLKTVEAQDEPTLLVVPEAVRLNTAGYTTV